MVASKDIDLTPLGAAVLEALRDDDRFREIIDDPFGKNGPPSS